MDNNKPRKLNALKHGLLAKDIILDRSELRPYNKFVKWVMAELNPQTAIEYILAGQVVANFWRLRRFMKLENEVFELAGTSNRSYEQGSFVDNFTYFINNNSSLDLLIRYNATVLRSFYRSLHEYQNLVNQRIALENAKNSQLP